MYASPTAPTTCRPSTTTACSPGPSRRCSAQAAARARAVHCCWRLDLDHPEQARSAGVGFDGTAGGSSIGWRAGAIEPILVDAVRRQRHARAPPGASRRSGCSMRTGYPSAGRTGTSSSGPGRWAGRCIPYRAACSWRTSRRWGLAWPTPCASPRDAPDRVETVAVSPRLRLASSSAATRPRASSRPSSAVVTCAWPGPSCATTWPDPGQPACGSSS